MFEKEARFKKFKSIDAQPIRAYPKGERPIEAPEIPHSPRDLPILPYRFQFFIMR
jgi:hypothetical protein